MWDIDSLKLFYQKKIVEIESKFNSTIKEKNELNKNY